MSDGSEDVPAAPATPSGPSISPAVAATTPDNAIAAAASPGTATGTGVGSTSTPSLDAAIAASDTPSSTPQKERHSLTLDQRRALRRWANSQASRPSHKQCIEWFQRQYLQTISQSTVSHSLSPKYARLDGEPQLSGSRLRFGNWPEVEKLVLLWYQQMTNAGRHPTNEELADKAKSIFTQLPRHRGAEPPEFSPGWIHRFKKRYGLLVRRQRRQSTLGSASGGDPAADIDYLTEAVQSIMSVNIDTNPVAIRDEISRSLGLDTSIDTCTRVRDEIVRYHTLAGPSHHGGAEGSPVSPTAAGLVGDASGEGVVGGAPGLASATTASQASTATAVAAAVAAAAAAAASATFSASRGNSHDIRHGSTSHHSNGNGSGTDLATSSSIYPGEDPDMVLQKALRQLQQQEDAEVAAVAAAAAAVASAQDAEDRSGLAPLLGSTPAKGSSGGDASFTPTPAHVEQPLRCPFCVNQRMLRSIKEAVDHMSTHVVV